MAVSWLDDFHAFFMEDPAVPDGKRVRSLPGLLGPPPSPQA
jgi:hypothetical protein